MVELVAFLLVQLLPLRRAVDRVELLGLLHHVARVDRDAPVDPLGGVPLLVLAALVQVEQAASAIVVFPAEARRSGGRDVPRAGLDRGRVVLVRAHSRLPGLTPVTADITRQYRGALAVAECVVSPA